jgi:hypothetical protein
VVGAEHSQLVDWMFGINSGILGSVGGGSDRTSSALPPQSQSHEAFTVSAVTEANKKFKFESIETWRKALLSLTLIDSS